ncbi:hypothetical protein Tco_0696099 [Tanacetum coccineum]
MCTTTESRPEELNLYKFFDAPRVSALARCDRLGINLHRDFNSARNFKLNESFYPQLLSEQNKLDLKSFKDKLPPNIEENPLFQRLSRYTTNVRVFPDPILFLAGLKPSWECGQQRPAIMAGENDTKPLKANEEPAIQPVEVTSDSGGSPKPKLFVVHPGRVAARIKDRKCKTRGGSSRPPVKRKLASGSSTSRATRAKTSSSNDDAHFLIVSDDDEGLPDVFELKDAVACHLKNICHYSSCVIEKLRGECDVMRSRKRAREEECERLRVKCEATMTKFEKNPTVVALQEKIFVLFAESKVTSLEAEKARLEAVEVSLQKEVEELKQDRKEVVSMVVPYVTMELVHSDDMGSLVGKLVSSAIMYGRRRAFEQVADMKEPFYLSKVKGYRPSYKKDHTQASNDLATATFPWLNEFVSDSLIPQLLLKIYC